MNGRMNNLFRNEKPHQFAPKSITVDDSYGVLHSLWCLCWFHLSNNSAKMSRILGEFGKCLDIWRGEVSSTFATWLRMHIDIGFYGEMILCNGGWDNKHSLFLEYWDRCLRGVTAINLLCCSEIVRMKCIERHLSLFSTTLSLSVIEPTCTRSCLQRLALNMTYSITCVLHNQVAILPILVVCSISNLESYAYAHIF